MIKKGRCVYAYHKPIGKTRQKISGFKIEFAYTEAISPEEGVCLAVRTMTPKKPNSALRKIAKGSPCKLAWKVRLTFRGIGHNPGT